MLFCVALIGDKVFYCRITGAILLALSIIVYYLSSMKCHDVFAWVTFDIDDKFQQHVGNHGQCAPGQRKSHRPQGLLPNPLTSIVSNESTVGKSHTTQRTTMNMHAEKIHPPSHDTGNDYPGRIIQKCPNPNPPWFQATCARTSVTSPKRAMANRPQLTDLLAFLRKWNHHLLWASCCMMLHESWSCFKYWGDDDTCIWEMLRLATFHLAIHRSATRTRVCMHHLPVQAPFFDKAMPVMFSQVNHEEHPHERDQHP